MNKLAYILIPAVLVLSLFFGMAISGAHDTFFVGMNMQNSHTACEGTWCGLLPDLTCSVHCLTSGLLQSFGQPLIIVLPILLLLFFALVVAVLPKPTLTGIPISVTYGLPPPCRALTTIVKRE